MAPGRPVSNHTKDPVIIKKRQRQAELSLQSYHRRKAMKPVKVINKKEKKEKEKELQRGEMMINLWGREEEEVVVVKEPEVEEVQGREEVKEPDMKGGGEEVQEVEEMYEQEMEEMEEMEEMYYEVQGGEVEEQEQELEEWELNVSHSGLTQEDDNDWYGRTPPEDFQDCTSHSGMTPEDEWREKTPIEDDLI
jgi:hypothetical protein